MLKTTNIYFLTAQEVSEIGPQGIGRLGSFRTLREEYVFLPFPALEPAPFLGKWPPPTAANLSQASSF